MRVVHVLACITDPSVMLRQTEAAKFFMKVEMIPVPSAIVHYFAVSVKMDTVGWADNFSMFYAHRVKINIACDLLLGHLMASVWAPAPHFVTADMDAWKSATEQPA